MDQISPSISSIKKLSDDTETESELDNDSDSPTTPAIASCRDGLTFKLSKTQLKNLFIENDENSLKSDLIEVKYALDLFLNSQFLQSETFLRKRFGTSLWV